MIGAITAGLFGTSGVAANLSYESIATTTLGSNQTSITFSSIPSTFKHLQIRYIARMTRAVSFASEVPMTINGDTSGANYYQQHYLDGNGASASAGAYNAGSVKGMYNANAVGNSATSGIFTAGVIDLLDYTNTNKNKVTRSLVGQDTNGAGNITLISSLWLSTAAVNSITFTCSNSAQLMTNTQFALYGIKG